MRNVFFTRTGPDCETRKFGVVRGHAQFRPIDKTELLDRVAGLPVMRWQYKGHEEIDHIGPTAEDFRVAFGLGVDPRYISTVDVGGAALAAILGLYDLVKEQQTVIASQNERLAALEERLAR